MERAPILHLAGSPTSPFWAELSLTYARGALDALGPSYRFINVYVTADGAWRFPDDLSDHAIEAAECLDMREALDRIARLDPSSCLPQMFCPTGMTRYRALVEALGIPLIGNAAEVMAICADKAWTRAIAASANVQVADAACVYEGEGVPLEPPFVVKPAIADNSEGIALVRDWSEIQPAMRAAFDVCEKVVVEQFIPPGREVRCGVVEIGGRAVPLPLEEYFVTERKPVRLPGDKIAAQHDGSLALMAKTQDAAWIVPETDAITKRVQCAALKAHKALGCRHYSLFDFRTAPDGTVYFLEAGPYCSFAPDSVLVTMMRAAGTDLPDFFAQTLDQVVGGIE